MNLIGQKVEGFYFDPKIEASYCTRNPLMDEHIGQVGIILDKSITYKNKFIIQFNNGKWLYPMDLTKKHLLDPISVIPKLTDYLTVQVSNDNETWYNANIIAQLPNGNYITDELIEWKYIVKPN